MKSITALIRIARELGRRHRIDHLSFNTVRKLTYLGRSFVLSAIYVRLRIELWVSDEYGVYEGLNILMRVNPRNGS